VPKHLIVTASEHNHISLSSMHFMFFGAGVDIQSFETRAMHMLMAGYETVPCFTNVSVLWWRLPPFTSSFSCGRVFVRAMAPTVLQIKALLCQIDAKLPRKIKLAQSPERSRAGKCDKKRKALKVRERERAIKTHFYYCSTSQLQ
jgi:hypothetical protein